MATIPIKVQGQSALDAVTTLLDVEARGASPTPLERQTLAAFPGFGPLALTLFPDPVTRQYKDPAWEAMGIQLKALLTPEDYASAAKATYTAFYTPRLLMRALFMGLRHCGVPDDATVLEPGIGIGRFCAVAPATMAFVGIEQDRLSGRICRLLYPQHEIRLEPIQHTHLDPESVDAVVGNVPFSQEKTAYWGRKLSLHELCIAKSVDALRPGGILALVVTHSLLDRQDDRFRILLSHPTQFLGAIRLPNDAFAAEGTRVVADLFVLKKRERNVDRSTEHWGWTESVPMGIAGVDIHINRYFHDHPEMVLGLLTRENRLYGAKEGYSVTSNGVLAQQLATALARLPKGVYAVPAPLLRTPRRVTPAPVRTLSEGSLSVDGGSIVQIQQGQPVVLRGNVTRVAHLIRLRDQTRDVLRTQHAGEPQMVRQAARAQLQQTYLAFVGAYGPINTVVVSERQDGGIVRRLPNLQTFRDDPDASLVMALEHYNESDGTATLAEIFTQDVVAPETPITHCESAAEALLVVLNTTGKVDLTAMADLTGQAVEVLVEELGELLYHDPASQQWDTADVYLSGHVKRKLAQAETACGHDPSYQRNVDALRAVQPPDLLPSEIEAHLGAPWIPTDVVQTFAAQIFGLSRWHVPVAHQASEALWAIEATYTAQSCEAAQVTYGTARVSGITLLTQALNLQFPTITDTIAGPDGKDKRVVNERETLAARDKQQALKDAWRAWLWEDAGRAERLVRLYNDLHNTHRAREMNGDHLTFPGMTPLITLTSAQKAAVWRIVTTGNTYLGHAVGGGKTYSLLAAGMKMKQVGLLRKPLYVVKNNTLEQFGRMALQLYPNGRFLMAGAEDFTKERRKLLAAKMATGQWDGIITTHSAFLHLGLSVRFQQTVIEEMIARYEALLVEHEREHGTDQHNIRKALEKQKSTYTARLETLLAVGRTDDGLLLDELGIDALFIDEAHSFRKLETPTKMQRVKGVQTEGSGRAMDLYLKTRYLNTLRPGHGVVFASGTPICNTLGELYGIQLMLTPQALEDSGIAHFDAWAATFGTLVDTLELGPDGETLRPVIRFGEFANLPELQQMLAQFADVQTAQQLSLPTPTLAGGEAEAVVVPLSPAAQTIQASLVNRYSAVRKGQAGRNNGEALKITSEGRKLAVDARLLAALAPEWPQSKLHVLCERVYQHWLDGQTERTTQLIFCDIGVNPTSWGFSFYEAVLDALVTRGITRQELARVDDADTDLKRHRLFTQVQQGQVRVLLGSTEKMGTGTNVQARLVALHHVDVPWLPNMLDQRNGRLLRQGNLHREWGKDVHIYVYGTAGTIEAFIWQALEKKAHWLHQFLTGAVTARRAEDVGEQELTFAQFKAIVSGNPALRTLAETDAEVRRLALLDKHHRDTRFQAQRRLQRLPEDLARQETYLGQLQADQATLAAWTAAGELSLEGQLYPSADEPLTAGEARRLLDPYLAPYVSTRGLSQTVRLGTYRGLRCGVRVSSYLGAEVWLEGATTRYVQMTRRTHPGVAFLAGLRELVADLPVRVAQAQHHLREVQQQGRTAAAQSQQVFGLAAYRDTLTALRDQLEVALSAGGEADQQPGLVAQIEALRAQHRSQPGHATERSTTVQVPIAEAITTTILRAQQAEEEQAAAD